MRFPTRTLEPGQFLMMTIRSHDQYNTTIYGLDDRYRGVHHGRRVILLNEEDCREAGLTSGDFVDITSHFCGQLRARLVLRCILSDSAALCRHLFPRGQRVGPHRQRGGKEQYASLKVDRDHAEKIADEAGYRGGRGGTGQIGFV